MTPLARARDYTQGIINAVREMPVGLPRTLLNEVGRALDALLEELEKAPRVEEPDDTHE